jgi:cyclophilin family peptidyl-prolyl cis-trans isomerase
MRELKVAEQERHRRRNHRLKRSGGAVVVVAVVIGLVVLLSNGSTPKKAATAKTTHAKTTHAKTTTSTTIATQAAVAPTCPPATAGGAAKRETRFTKAPPACISRTGVYDATFTTDVGTFVVRMHASASFAAVNNFVFLARYHFFDGTTFPRVIKGFVVQGGSPTDTTSGGPGYSFTGNKPPSSCTAKADCYPVGGVAMANSAGPSTDGSQFFIVLPGGQTQLDSEPNYTLFGQVVSGRAGVDRIGAGGAAATSATGTPRVVHHIVRVTITPLSP